MKAWLLVPAVLALALFFLRRAKGWETWGHILEASGYAAVLGGLAGIAEGGWVRALSYAGVSGISFGILYLMGGRPASRDAVRARRIERRAGPPGRGVRLAAGLGAVLALLALPYLILVAVFPGALVALTIALSVLAVLAVVVIAWTRYRSRRLPSEPGSED